jgi:hypothetical protein
MDYLGSKSQILVPILLLFGRAPSLKLRVRLCAPAFIALQKAISYYRLLSAKQ